VPARSPRHGVHGQAFRQQNEEHAHSNPHPLDPIRNVKFEFTQKRGEPRGLPSRPVTLSVNLIDGATATGSREAERVEILVNYNARFSRQRGECHDLSELHQASRPAAGTDSRLRDENSHSGLAKDQASAPIALPPTRLLYTHPKPTSSIS
jgi:hypothetical protein